MPISSLYRENKKIVYLKGISGFGNRIRAFLEALLYSKITDRRLIVDWTDGVYAPKGVNAFDYFFDCAEFKPTNNPSSLVPVDFSVIPPSWKGGLGCNWRERIDYIQWRNDDLKRDNPYSYFHFNIDRLDYPEDVIVWISWTFRWAIFQNHRKLFPKNFVRLPRDAIKKQLLLEYLPLKNHILEEINNFHEKYFSPSTIGVHVRYTDNLSPRFITSRNVLIDSYFPLIDLWLERHSNSKIFLCTDNRLVLELFRKRYDNIISTEKFYSDDMSALHLSGRCENKIRMGEEALIDMYLLSRCSHIVHTGISSFTEISFLLMKSRSDIAINNLQSTSDSVSPLKSSLSIADTDSPSQVSSNAVIAACKENIFLMDPESKVVSVKTALVNVALNKTASQSSMSHWSHPGESMGAVSGIKSGEYSFHTNLEPNPWWQVDLKEIFSLFSIVIYNRGIAGTLIADRAKSLVVLVSVDGNTWEQIYSGGISFGGILDNEPLFVSCKEVNARYVRLQLEDTNYLHLDEVEIFVNEERLLIK